MWTYPTYPPPIQSELFYTALEKCRAQSQKMLGAFKPPDTPSARAVCVRDTRFLELSFVDEVPTLCSLIDCSLLTGILRLPRLEL